MSDRTIQDRIIFHDALGVMEVDWSDWTFTTEAQVNEFYDEIDRKAGATGKRWYFLVNYVGCVISPAAWPRFAERGKYANITYGLGTARIGATAETRDAIRQRAKGEMFRANIFGSRDQALLALVEMRKRREIVGGIPSADTAYL